MLTFAVCDDDPAQREQGAALLRDYLGEQPGLTGRVLPFSSGQELLEAAREQGGFDLYLLDIIMPGLNGIETGLRLREMGAGGEIIYLTSSADYAVDSYNVRAFFYLVRPVERDKLFSVLERAVERLQRRRSEGVLVETPAGARRLLLERILYVERKGRRLRYYCTDGTVDSQTIQVSFRDAVGPLLAHRQFCLCGASFLLNLEHVAGVDANSARLDNGGEVFLPRAAAAAFKSAWGRYWLEGR